MVIRSHRRAAPVIVARYSPRVLPTLRTISSTRVIRFHHREFSPARTATSVVLLVIKPRYVIRGRHPRPQPPGRRIHEGQIRDRLSATITIDAKARLAVGFDVRFDRGGNRLPGAGIHRGSHHFVNYSFGPSNRFRDRPFSVSSISRTPEEKPHGPRSRRWRSDTLCYKMISDKKVR